jgi:hypothetical protein
MMIEENLTLAVLRIVGAGNGATVMNAAVGVSKALAGAIGEVSSRLELELLLRLRTCIKHLVGGRLSDSLDTSEAGMPPEIALPETSRTWR